MLASGLSIIGILDGRRAYETPGTIVDLKTYEPLLFGINPGPLRTSKDLNAAEHIVPGRHSPLQEPVSGGPEILQFDLVLVGSGALAMASTKLAVNWLESLMFPDRGGLMNALKIAHSGGGVRNAANRLASQVTQVGHRVSFTYGTWIVNRHYLVRRVEVVTGRGKHPILLMPYRAVVSLTMHEDSPQNVDYLTRRWGLPG